MMQPSTRVAFFLVEREPVGRLGANPAAPRVRGKPGALDKRPWREVEPPRGPVEVVLRPLLLGESIAPFRLLTSVLSVVPIDRAQSSMPLQRRMPGFVISRRGCATSRVNG